VVNNWPFISLIGFLGLNFLLASTFVILYNSLRFQVCG
jgi:hypothetical protein